jgi:cytochrome P450 PksS
LIPVAIEEMLRYYPPFPGTIRRAMRDVEVGGATIAKDDRMFVLFASANRDESVFDRADEFIIDREPNRHLGFGMGIHYCVGAPLARIEGQIALQVLLPRIKRITVGEVDGSAMMRPGGPDTMPVTFELER